MNKADELFEFHQFESLIQGLIDNKFGCCDDFFEPPIICGLRAISDELNRKKEAVAAGIGSSNDFHQNLAVRGDKIKWIDDTSINPFELIYLSKVNRFITHLNSTCFTDIKSFESHYAMYEMGRFYKRHIDQFKIVKGRQFSIILYLNQDWNDGDGGNLSLYLDHEVRHIMPIGGRMIFFRSDEMEHEVHPSLTRNRQSIAGWLKND